MLRSRPVPRAMLLPFFFFLVRAFASEACGLGGQGLKFPFSDIAPSAPEGEPLRCVPQRLAILSLKLLLV